MGNTEAANNIEIINGRMESNNEYREEARTAIAEIEAAREQAARAGTLSNLLAEGTETSVNEVITTAPDAILEFETAFNEVSELVNTLYSET
jgi:hypothetical protein